MIRLVASIAVSLQLPPLDGIFDGIRATFLASAYAGQAFPVRLNIIARYVERMLSTAAPTGRFQASPSGMASLPTIRTASRADAAAIESLYRQLVDDENVNVTESQLQVLDDDARTRLLVCEIDGRALGTVLVSLCADPMCAEQT